MIKRSAKARWEGNLKEGQGTLETQSKTLSQTPYSFHSRFEEGKGTNPEELIGAAHAGCFTMALSSELTKAGFNPAFLETTAVVQLDPVPGGFSVSEITLSLRGKVPGAPRDKCLELANQAKANCPISKLMNARITLEANFD